MSEKYSCQANGLFLTLILTLWMIHIHQEACQEPQDLLKHPGALPGRHLTPILRGPSLDMSDQLLVCLDCV